MSTIKRIAKNSSVLFIGQIVGSILSLILGIFIARKVGDANYGKYSFAIAFTTFFTIFSDLGYSTLLVREVSKNKQQASVYLSNVISIRILLSIIFFIFLVILINIMGYPQDTKNIVYLIGGSGLLTAFASIFNMIFRAFEKMEYDAFLNTLINILKVILGIGILYFGYGLFGLGVSFVFVGILDVIIGFIICNKKFVKSTIGIDFVFWKNSIKIALPICLSSVFGLIYIRIDTVLLSLMKGDAVVGWYNAAYSLTLGLTAVPDLLMNALLPIMAFKSTSDKKNLIKIYEKSFKYLLMLALPLAVGITILSDKIIFLFYGSEYSNSIIALKILAWDILLVFLYRCIYYLLIVIDKQNQIMTIAAITAGINIGLNLILIPFYSYIGSGIATIITEIILLILFIYISVKNDCRIPLFKISVKPIIACIIMATFIYILLDINFILLIMSSIGIYFIILYIIKGITREEINMVKKIFIRN